ncbi:MAG TPA: AAA family ATPase, partial [Solirubrobacter sp.]|nr:AAA family ATPase [Solirubrobacter sp.]
MLIGRDAERDRIAMLLDTARAQRSGALVVCGEPGIGKTALCAWAVGHALGMRVLTMQGIESEAALAYAGLSELFAGELERIAGLPEPQAIALDGALARRHALGLDRFAIGAAVLSLLTLVAHEQPVLVVVDDAQWVDASSAEALLFAARRLRDEGVASLVASRPEGVFGGPDTGLPRLTLGGLDPVASEGLLESAHGQLPPQVAARVVEHSEGNPLALLEGPLLLSDEQLAGEQPIAEPLPIGSRLTSALLTRFSGLPATTRSALLLASASDVERLEPLIDALAEAGLTLDAFDPAELAGVLELGPERFRFRHPLLRAAIYHHASPAERRSAHAILARVADGEAAAWHRARAAVGRDEATAAMLEHAGFEARRRGASAAAAAALERAAQLSGGAAARARRLTEAARDAHIGGQSRRALGMLDEALSDADGPVARADVQHLRGRIMVSQGRTRAAFELLTAEAERVRAVDPGRSAAMLTEACFECALSADVARALAMARGAYALASHSGDELQAFAGVMLAGTLTLSGEGLEASLLLDRFMPLLTVLDPISEAGNLVAVGAEVLLWLERHDAAGALLERIIAAARAASAPAPLLWPLSSRADLNLRLGRWPVAIAEAQEAASLGHEMARSVYAAYALECLAQVAAAQGDEQACREHAASAMELAEDHD